MASDDFDGANQGLFSHSEDWATAGGDATEPLVQDNQLEPPDTGWQSYASRYSASSEDLSQVVFVGFATLDTNRDLFVRCSATILGYGIDLDSISGDNYTTLNVTKNGAWKGWATSLTVDGTGNNTLKITATDNGGNVDVKGFIADSEEASWTDTSDVIASGNPGLGAYSNGGAGTAQQVAFDDWTDGAEAPPSGWDLKGGMSLMGIGL